MTSRPKYPKRSLREVEAKNLDDNPMGTEGTQSISVAELYSPAEIKTLNVADFMPNSNSARYIQNGQVRNRFPKKEKEKPVLDQQLFDKHFGFKRIDLTLGRKINWYFRQIGRWRKAEWWDFILHRLPIARWLSHYKWREWILSDLIGGTMVSIMTVPQALAYGYLVGVPPNYGLISSIFGPLIYAMLGTSKHTSPGSFAIVALMVGSVVEQYSQPEEDMILDNDTMTEVCCYTKSVAVNPSDAIDVACGITLVVGLMQILFGLLNAGLLAVWLSDHLVQGLTSGAAIHVLTSQLKSITGIRNVPPTSEPFGLVKFYLCFFRQITDFHLNSFLTAMLCMSLLLISSYVIDPILKKWTSFKFPMEFVVVAGSVLIVWLSQDTHFQLDIPHVGFVESGLAVPRIPPLERFVTFLGPGTSIAIVSFAIHIALAKLACKKFNYEIDANQEWFALGAMHTIASCFGCFAGGSSLGRTMMQVKFGTRSQFSTMISVAIIIIFVYGAATLIYYLPKAVLASIVVVAMKDLFIQLFRALEIRKESTVDFLIFIVTLTTVLVINVNYGLVCGVSFALLTVVFRTQWVEGYCLGRMPGSSEFKGVNHYTAATEIPGIKVFRFDSPLYFANAELFIEQIHKACGINPIMVKAKLSEQLDKEAKRKKKLEKEKKSKKKPEKDKKIEKKGDKKEEKKDELPITPSMTNQTSTSTVTNEQLELHLKGRDANNDGDKEENVREQLTHIIIDCSSIPYVDLMGKDAMIQAFNDYASINVTVLFSHCKVACRQLFEQCGFYKKVPKNRMFVNLDDAVTQAQKEQKLQITALTKETKNDLPVARSPTQKTVGLVPEKDKGGDLQSTQSYSPKNLAHTQSESRNRIVRKTVLKSNDALDITQKLL